MDVLTSFGIKPVYLIAQAVNFFILLFVLKKLLYQPILKILNDRKQKIADSMKNAEEIQKRLEQSEIDREKKLKKAIEEAQEIINEAKKSADEIVKEAQAKAQADVTSLIERSEQSLKVEREKLRQEMRSELSQLVVAAMQKVSPRVLTKADQQTIIQDSLGKVKNLS